jgi:hypothetical protein
MAERRDAARLACRSHARCPFDWRDWKPARDGRRGGAQAPCQRAFNRPWVGYNFPGPPTCVERAVRRVCGSRTALPTTLK